MKQKILQLLKENLSMDSSRFVSGEALSQRLGVSRTAVWKHIQELRHEGYSIESSSRKGYRLISMPDILNACELGCGLETSILGKDILYFDTIDSTNNYAKEAAHKGCAEGTVIVAGSQSAGKGRLGRIWDSSGGKGIWMSVVLRPPVAPEDVQVITLGASVAVVEAIKEITGIEAGIKWPNDIVLDGRKLCGILTEMNSEMERIHFLVLGIGINVNHNMGDFPLELQENAVSLKMYASEKLLSIQGDLYNRSEIIKKILFKLEQVYNTISKGCTADIINEWKKYSVTLGKEVRIAAKNSEFTAVARDVTNDGRLVVECMDGTIREVLSGEVSIRGILGYI